MRGRTNKLQLQQYCRFGLGLDRVRLILSDNINITSNFIISTGQTSNEFPALRQCRPLAAIIAHDHQLTFGRPRFFGTFFSWPGNTTKLW
jgi:hypothetical protein